MEPTIHFLYINAPEVSFCGFPEIQQFTAMLRNICTRTSSKATSRREC